MPGVTQSVTGRAILALPKRMALSIRLFGPLEITLDGQPLPKLARPGGERLLALLAVRGGGPLPRPVVAATLWPESEEARAQFYLRRSLTEVRRALGPDVARYLTEPTTRSLGMNPESVECDLIRFDAALAARDHSGAAALYGGPLLEGWDDEWVLSERTRCEAAFLDALEATALGAKGTREAVGVLRRIVAIEPGRESAWRALMEALASEGEAGELVQAYRRLRIHLRREARIEPSPETRACYERLRDDLRRRAAAFRPPSTVPLDLPAEPTARIPKPRTPLIGRAAEIESVRTLLGSERLATLVGIGGVGKTRLALAVLEGGSSNGETWWADLSALRDPALVRGRLADAVGVPEESLTGFLSERTGLLAVDNCEQVLDGAARAIADLLDDCPGLKVLATSREPLGVPGESVWRVPALSASESVALFLDRAKRVRADWTLTPETAPAVAGICRRLDDIALAIELATALLSVLTVEEIAERLDRRFEVLRFGARTLEARQRTLEAAMDWSWELLAPSERTLLGRLSVFAGGWNLEGAESVCGPGVLGDLRALAEKSLVVHEPPLGRYRLLETVREYAAARLDPADAPEVLRRHAEYFTGLAARAHARRGGGEAPRWMERLEADHDNLRAALDWSVERDPAGALRLGGSLYPFWRERGYRVEGSGRLRAALAAAPNGHPERARALLGLGGLCYDFDEYAAALAHLKAAREAALESADGWCAAESLRLEGLVLWNRGEHVSARACYEASLEGFRAEGRRDGMASVLACLGHLAWNLGDLPTATDFNTESQALYRTLGDEGGIAETSAHLGLIARSAEDYPLARRHLGEALDVRRRLGLRAGVAAAEHHLGVVAFLEGNLDEAAERLNASLSVWGELSDRGWQALSLNYLGLVFRDRGELAEAEACLVRALAIRRATPSKRAVAGVLFALGGVSLRRGDDSLAAARFAESVRLRQEIGHGEGVCESLCGLAVARAALGDAARSAACLRRARAGWDGPLPKGAQRFWDEACAKLGVPPGEIPQTSAESLESLDEFV